MIKIIILFFLLIGNVTINAQKIITKQKSWKAKKSTLNCKEGQGYLPIDATFHLIDTSNFKLELYANGHKSEVLVELTNPVKAYWSAGNTIKVFKCIMKMVVADVQNTETYNGEAILSFHDNGKIFTLQIELPNQEEECTTNFQFIPKKEKKGKKT
jgi:hypothetical protein